MNSSEKGNLYLIPCTLGDSDPDLVIPAGAQTIIRELDIFFVEELRTARRYLKKIKFLKPFEEVTFHEYNEHTKDTDPGFQEMIKQLLAGKSIGIISEAGCPAVADPGSELVKEVHRHGIRVVPLTGPSSILLALMASGMNGQNFAFLGYLPKEQSARTAKLSEIEKTSSLKKQTQIFIETPYRNNHLLEDILKHCHSETLLCIACEVSLSGEFIRTKKIADWKKQIPDLNKKPAVFLLMAN